MIKGFDSDGLLMIREITKSIKKAESQSGNLSALGMSEALEKTFGGSNSNYYPSKGRSKVFSGGTRTFEIQSNRRMKNYNKAFARNLMQAYIYCFIFHIKENPFGYKLRDATIAIKKEELSGGSKSKDIKVVSCKSPPWLRKSNKYPDLTIPQDIIRRSEMPWMETGGIADSLRFRFTKSGNVRKIIVYAGFLKANRTKGERAKVSTTAAQRAGWLEYGTINQPPRPLIRLILRSNMFQEMKRELIEIMNGKRSKGEIRADYIADKVIEGLKEFSQEEE